MAIKLVFDSANNVITPTLVLATKSGRKLGDIPASNLTLTDSMNSYSEMSFTVSKFDNGVEYHLWNKLKSFKLAYCREWDTWFELTVEIDETDDLVKNVTAKSLGESELSQINLDGVEINSEADIAREDYIPTVLYNPIQPNGSLLHRLLEKAPHYRIAHVDESIANLQRTFTFDGTSIYDGLQEVAKELNCIFIFGSGSDEDGNIDRSISVYDLYSNCLDCETRDDFYDSCPECNGHNIIKGFGEDTTIFISTENLADDISFSTDVDSVKNCFRLVAGDDLMTATVRNCNPNGSNYIWYLSDEMKEDMSDALVARIKEYDEQYQHYYDDYVVDVPAEILTTYNSLVEKYQKFSETLNKAPDVITGYSELMSVYYDTIDFELFLKSGLMPSSKLQDTDAGKEAAKLTSENLAIIAVTDLKTCSSATASSAVLSMAKTIVDSRYQVKVNQGNLDGTTWTGSFSVTNYSDEEDTSISSTISVEITDEYEKFVKQKIDKLLSKDGDEVTDIVSLFDLDDDRFKEEIKKYCLSRLTTFYDSCQSCIDILIEQGVADKLNWENLSPNLYDDLYMPYYNKLLYLQNEISLRESEVQIVVGLYDSENMLIADGLQTIIEKERNSIQNALNFESFVGEELWREFITYRRDDTYQNSNYISDGLDNTKLFEKALEFIQVAKKEIFKSATMQHTISATLKNLLAMVEFAPIVKHFKVGNWIRIKVDNTIYRLRLIDYTIDFENLNSLNVTFSDVLKTADGISDAESILNQAASMATSYGAVAKQASQGKKSSDQLEIWSKDGISLSLTKIVGTGDGDGSVADSHGFLFRKYDAIEDTYDPRQLKINYSSISLTDNDWESVKTAIGSIYYTNLITGELEYAYGINCEVMVGKLILGEKLGIYNSSGSLSFDNNGFVVRNDDIVVAINPNDKSIFNIRNNDENLFSLDDDGDLNIVGNITAKSLILEDGVTINHDKVDGLSFVAVTGKYDDLIDIPSFATVATSGKYSDLIEIPTFATVASTGKYSDLIDKPVFATVATTGSYIDLKNLPDLSGIETNAANIADLIARVEALEGIS